MNARPMPKVRTLLGVLFALVLVTPILMVGAARVYENQLVRNCEELLIAEAVVVGEAYRRAIDPEAALAPLPPPADMDSELFRPFAPQLDIRKSPMLPRAERDKSATSTVTRAGAELGALLQRTIVRNLSGVRVLDARGVVVASALPATGYGLAHLPEVQAALQGDYLPVLRKRFSDEPAPPLSSLSRAANIRVSIAVPIFKDPRARAGQKAEVIGVIYNSRTPLDVSKALWLVRGDLAAPVVVSVLLTLAAAMFLATTISRPLMRLRKEAEAVARGDRGGSLDVGKLAPQEIQVLADSLGKMRDQLEARADYIREFAANTAHELKTPLTSLRGASELLLEEYASMTEEQRARFLGNIHSDAVRMDSLVQRILHLARIESTRPERERIDLRAYLEGTVERYRRSGAQLSLEYLASSPSVEMSADQLDSLISNLIDNAVRHGAGKPVELTVRDAGGGRRELIVRDRGPALPSEHFERVFERFYTTERARGGTGLGLAIVKAIADAHGGSVRVERHEEGGASFIVLIS